MKKVSYRTEIILAVMFALSEIVVIIWVGSAFAFLGQLQSYAIGFCFGLIFHPVIITFASLLKKRLRKT